MNVSWNFFIGLGLAIVAVNPAGAQSSNTPYGPGRIGISSAYRQAIINSQILGVRPKALVRGRDGSLLDVQNRHGEAIVVAADGTIVPGARPNQGWGTGLGTGLGWIQFSNFRSGGSYAGGSIQAHNLDYWIAQLPAGPGMEYVGTLIGSDATPINAWIQQLNLL